MNDYEGSFFENINQLTPLEFVQKREEKDIGAVFDKTEAGERLSMEGFKV